MATILAADTACETIRELETLLREAREGFSACQVNRGIGTIEAAKPHWDDLQALVRVMGIRRDA
jgi:hypothetical protein